MCSCTTWRAPPIDLTARLNAPPAQGGASPWHWALEGSRHITYRDVQGRVHEYLELQGVWYHADLTGHTGGPLAASDPIGYAPADHEHVLYLGVDGHLHELCFDFRAWHHHDLTASARAPEPAGPPAGAYLKGRHVVIYRGTDGRAHALRHRRDWRHHPLEALGLLSGDPRLASSGALSAVSYTSADGLRRWARLQGEAVAVEVADLPA